MSPLASFFLALKVAEDRGLCMPAYLGGELHIERAWNGVVALWFWLDTDEQPPFPGLWALRRELGSYELNDDESIAYIDTCEVDYLIEGDCQHTRQRAPVETTR
jgi:hypothetical protein